MLNRRFFLAGAAAAAIGGCTQGLFIEPMAYVPENGMLVPPAGEPFTVAPVNMANIPGQFHRQMVRDPTGQPPGTITVDPGQRFLYLSMADGRAMRYGIGVGRQGFGWSGEAVIQRKQKWPSWHPPVEMQARDENARRWADGMPGGSTNPLGARALYLYQNGRDTLYRLHGTAEPNSIGHAVSSGCVRLLNADIIDLYDRVPVGTRVVVLAASDPIARIGDALTGAGQRIGTAVQGVVQPG